MKRNGNVDASSFDERAEGVEFAYRRDSDALRAQRQQQLNLHPPAPGSILVTGTDEEWSVIQPNLESADANEDGFAVKKMIAAGAGIPVSFLAESASSSKAESSGMEDSACRNFRQRQQTLMYITETVLRHVLARGALYRKGFDPHAEIHVYGDDIAAPGLSEGGIVTDVSEGDLPGNTVQRRQDTTLLKR